MVGDDFPKSEVSALSRRGIGTEGLERVAGGKTFRWGGRYLPGMNERETLFTDLNVFEHFAPKLPEEYRDIHNVFLGNIDPDLQLEVLNQVRAPRFVACDTMNLWINIKQESLLKEARMLAETESLAEAGRSLCRMGLERVLIKKGEHGCLMFGPEGVFAAPALLLPKVVDPTGAGDSFAGGMLGWLASRRLTPVNWRRAILVGTAMASFCCEDFSVGRLRSAKAEDVKKRTSELRAMMRVASV